MTRQTSSEAEQSKIARFNALRQTIAGLEKQQRQVLRQGKLAPQGAWVARYQVRQNNNKYWYYKMQMPTPYFQTSTSNKLSKYKHLGKAGTQAHIDAVTSVIRRNLWEELQSRIDDLKNCLDDIGFGFEQTNDSV